MMMMTKMDVMMLVMLIQLQQTSSRKEACALCRRSSPLCSILAVDEIFHESLA